MNLGTTSIILKPPTLVGGKDNKGISHLFKNPFASFE